MRSTRRALVESLEGRKLLAATLPSALGDFVGNVQYAGGTAQLELNVTHQKGGSLSGVGVLSLIPNAGKLHGSINKKSVVHLSAQGTKFGGSVVGTLTGDTLAGTLVYRIGKAKGTGTFTLTRSPL